MTTEPLEVIIVIFLITVALFAIYSYSRTTATSSGLTGRRLLARDVASVIAGMWKYDFINGTYSYADFSNEVRNFLSAVESEQGVGIGVNLTFVYKDGNNKTFVLYNASKSGGTSASAVAPVMVSWNCTPDKVYALSYTDEIYYSVSGGIIRTYTFDNLTFFVIAYHHAGVPRTEGGAYVTLDYSFTDEWGMHPSSGNAYAPIENGGAILNVSIPSYRSFIFEDPPNSLDVTLKYYPNASASTPSKTWTFTYGPSDFKKGSAPSIILTFSGNQSYLYLLGETIDISGAGAPTWTISNRKGEILTESGLAIQLIPPDMNPGFFIQGPFNITVVDASGTVHIPFYVLPYMVLLKVRVVG